MSNSTAKPNLGVAGLLIAATVTSQLAMLALSTRQTDQEFASTWAPSLATLLLVTTPLVFLGLLLGKSVKLGAPILTAMVDRQDGVWRQFARNTALSAVLGLALGLGLVGLRYALGDQLPAEMPAFGFRGVTGGMIVSVGAAIAEEVWFRLGLMTIIVYAATRLLRRDTASPFIPWTVILLMALLFAVAHIPQLTSYGAASPRAVLGTLFGNTLVGTLYGWFYWKRGIFAAITAHFFVDVAIHVLPAIPSLISG